jgi:hypothetical protein
MCSSGPWAIVGATGHACRADAPWPAAQQVVRQLRTCRQSFGSRKQCNSTRAVPCWLVRLFSASFYSSADRCSPPVEEARSSQLPDLRPLPCCGRCFVLRVGLNQPEVLCGLKVDSDACGKTSTWQHVGAHQWPFRLPWSSCCWPQRIGSWMSSELPNHSLERSEHDRGPHLAAAERSVAGRSTDR